LLLRKKKDAPYIDLAKKKRGMGLREVSSYPKRGGIRAGLNLQKKGGVEAPGFLLEKTQQKEEKTGAGRNFPASKGVETPKGEKNYWTPNFERGERR